MRVRHILLSDARHAYLRWLTATRNLSPHTVRAYRGDLAVFEDSAGGDLPARDISAEVLMTFFEGQRAAGLSSATLRRRAAGVRGLCQWLRERGELESDPMRTIHLSFRRERRLPRSIPHATLDGIVAVVWSRACTTGVLGPTLRSDRPHDATLLVAVAVLLSTGVRANELVCIRCSDVDLSRGAIRVRGKGNAERVVYLPNDWLRNTLARYLVIRHELSVEHDLLLFNQALGPLTTEAVRTRIARVAAVAAPGVRVTPHMFRHTAATRLVEAGVDIRLIQTLLGHASLTTTEIYTHVSNVALQRALRDVDVLGALMPP